MNSKIVKESLQKLSEVISFKFPATGWYFSSKEIKDSISFEKKKWICMVMYLKKVTKKDARVCFSEGKTGCAGSGYYCGSSDFMEGNPGLFLSEGEGYKKDKELRNAFYDAVQALPAKEKFKNNPKGVVGLLDPCVRKLLPDDVVSFSIPSNRLIEMSNNIKGIFLDKKLKSTNIGTD